MSLQDDWLKYVVDSSLFDKYHFGPLITDTEEPVDLEAAFGKLPNGNELIKRIERVRRETAFTGLYHVPAMEDRLNKDQLKSLAERYADSVAKRLREIGEVKQADCVYYNPLEFISYSDFKTKEKARGLQFINAAWEINSSFNRWKNNRPPCYHGLKEAVLFMTKFPPVTRYILSAIVEYPVDDEAYYELWKGGGDIEFCENRTLIILPDDYEG